jgi:hypothetical protein
LLLASPGGIQVNTLLNSMVVLPSMKSSPALSGDNAREEKHWRAHQRRGEHLVGGVALDRIFLMDLEMKLAQCSPKAVRSYCVSFVTEAISIGCNFGSLPWSSDTRNPSGEKCG